MSYDHDKASPKGGNLGSALPVHICLLLPTLMLQNISPLPPPMDKNGSTLFSTGYLEGQNGINLNCVVDLANKDWEVGGMNLVHFNFYD